MKIDINIDKIVLDGFNYHDHNRIVSALKHELAILVSEKGIKENQIGQQHEFSKLDLGLIKISKDMNPRLIGSEIARSIYKGLK